MKRSQINEYLAAADSFWSSLGFRLPPFAYFTGADRDKLLNDDEYREIRDNALGWDITDFGLGDFEQKGLLLFTIRNGNYHRTDYPKPYAEKIMMVGEGQITPFHFHESKMEDIINRGGGNLLVKVYNSCPDGSLDDTEVEIHSDGRIYKTASGSVIRLKPGESMTMTQGLYHSFWGEEGCGPVMVGEVSMVNDDRTDNRFLEEVGRFPDIEEDCEPLWLLGQDYSV